jgi:hypothetical protein
VWLAAGAPLRPDGGPDAASSTVRAETDRLMAELGALVDRLRERYPARWAEEHAARRRPPRDRSARG